MTTQKTPDQDDLLRNACELENDAVEAASRGDSRIARSLHKRARATFEQACLLDA